MALVRGDRTTASGREVRRTPQRTLDRSQIEPDDLSLGWSLDPVGDAGNVPGVHQGEPVLDLGRGGLVRGGRLDAQGDVLGADPEAFDLASRLRWARAAVRRLFPRRHSYRSTLSVQIGMLLPLSV